MLATAEITELAQAECWRLLHNAHVGRIATTARGRIEIFPLMYLVRGGALLFRIAASTDLEGMEAQQEVAFEIDGEDSQWHWSVLVHGTAERLVSELDIIESGALELVSWVRSDKFDFVRITPDDVTGHRIDRHEFRRTSMVG